MAGRCTHVAHGHQNFPTGYVTQAGDLIVAVNRSWNMQAQSRFLLLIFIDNPALIKPNADAAVHQ